MIETRTHAVLGRRNLSSSAYVLRLERGGLDFEAGQYIHVGPLPGIDRREYSIYSSTEDDFLEILVKEIPGGSVSPKLRRLEKGELLAVEGPFGFFRLEGDYLSHSYLFIATGTGISPFHCFVRSLPNLDFRLVHGVRWASELYDHSQYAPNRLHSCLSREEGRSGPRRVTDWLRERPVPEERMVYLCGNCDMIYECYAILASGGVGSDRIHAEVYF